MQIGKTISQFTALGLAFLMVGSTMPLSAADLHNASLGSVSAVGSVQLRGVAIDRDGTVFSGDHMNVGNGAYARLQLGTGSKVEVTAGSDVTVSKDGDTVNVQMASGNVSFKGNGQKLRMTVGAFEVKATADATGSVAYVGKETFGVRVTSGSATVLNTQTKKSFTIQKGDERLVSLTTGVTSPTMSQLASNAPAAVPAPARRRADMSTGMTIALMAAAATGASVITYFAVREDKDAHAAQIKALTNLNAVSQNAAAVSSAAASVSSTASAAQTAINASNLSATQKAALVAQVTTTTAKANSAASKVATLTTKVQTLQNAIANQDEGPTDAQKNELNSLLSELTTARNEVNDSVTLLNTLLSQAQSQGVGNLPSNNQGQVGGPTITSASVPL